VILGSGRQAADTDLWLQAAAGDHAIRRCAAAQLGWAGQER